MDYSEIQKAGNKVSTIANELVNPPIYIITEVVSVSRENGE
jgi:hypothetical protein